MSTKMASCSIPALRRARSLIIHLVGLLPLSFCSAYHGAGKSSEYDSGSLHIPDADILMSTNSTSLQQDMPNYSSLEIGGGALAKEGRKEGRNDRTNERTNERIDPDGKEIAPQKKLLRSATQQVVIGAAGDPDMEFDDAHYNENALVDPSGDDDVASNKTSALVEASLSGRWDECFEYNPDDSKRSYDSVHPHCMSTSMLDSPTGWCAANNLPGHYLQIDVDVPNSKWARVGGVILQPRADHPQWPDWFLVKYCTNPCTTWKQVKEYEYEDGVYNIYGPRSTNARAKELGLNTRYVRIFPQGRVRAAKIRIYPRSDPIPRTWNSFRAGLLVCERFN